MSRRRRNEKSWSWSIRSDGYWIKLLNQEIKETVIFFRDREFVKGLKLYFFFKFKFLKSDHKLSRGGLSCLSRLSISSTITILLNFIFQRIFSKKIIYLYIVCVFCIVSEKVNWISLGESHRLVIVDFWGFHWMTHKNRIFIIIIKIRNFRENSNFILIIICLHFFLSLGIASEYLNSNVIIIHIHTYLIIYFFREKVPTWN